MAIFRKSTRWVCSFAPGSLTLHGVWRIAAAVAAAATLMLLTVAFCFMADAGVPMTRLSPVAPSTVALFAAQFAGACGEELGWRCLLQPTVGATAGPFTTGIVVGLIWGLWHVQLVAFGPVYVLAFLAGTVGMSILLAVLLRAPGTLNLFAAGLFHFIINISLRMVLDEETGHTAPMVTFGVAALVMAACTAVVGRVRRW